MHTLKARFMGPTWGPSGPTVPRWAPCWPHEFCYLGRNVRFDFGKDTFIIHYTSVDPDPLRYSSSNYISIDMVIGFHITIPHYCCMSLSTSKWPLCFIKLIKSVIIDDTFARCPIEWKMHIQFYKPSAIHLNSDTHGFKLHYNILIILNTVIFPRCYFSYMNTHIESSSAQAYVFESFMSVLLHHQ